MKMEKEMKKKMKITGEIFMFGGIASSLLFGIFGTRVPNWTVLLMFLGCNLSGIANLVKSK